MKYKYKLTGGIGNPVFFLSAGVDLQRKPDPKLIKYVNLPTDTTEDIITFGAKYVESFANLNRAWFDNEELINAYGTIPFKAIDIEHELDKIVGHIHTHAFIDREDDKLITPEDFLKFTDEKKKLSPLDVIVGGVAYIDRFPNLEDPISTKAFKISMECWMESFDILLENGTRFTIEEAIAYGLEGFVDQLMGPFSSQQEFEDAHTLRITAGAGPQDLKVYKYLKGILFSGAGLTITPACPSCHILSTDRDECDDECGGQKMAASTENKAKIYELDITKVEDYQRKEKEKNKKSQVQVADTVNTLVPPGGPTPDTPQNETNVNAPSICPQYKERIFVGQADPLTGGNEILHENWCQYAEVGCEVAGNRQDKGCLRWIRDESGEATDLYDTRNFKEGVGEPANGGDDIDYVAEAASVKRAMQSLMEYHKLSLEKIEEEMEQAATWTSQYINSLPNSSFAVVETGYKEGESPKSARHLPYKDSGGKVDLPHLRNALARMNQIKSVLGNDTDAELRDKAKRKLAPLAKKHFPDTTVTED